MSNLDIWNRFADIDPKFTKAISGRDYSGTSPNPQYVVQCLTELFGPVGKGFGWSVLAEDFTDLGGTHLHWCRIRFWWKDDDGIHECEQYGQTKAAYPTSKGYHRVDEDAPKKSLTDAIVKAASHLGIAANIFLGRWDDQKYVAAVNDDYRGKEKQAAQLSKEKARPIFSTLQDDMRLNKSQADLERWLKDADVNELRAQLPEDWNKELRRMAKEYWDSLPKETRPEDQPSMMAG